MIKLSNITYRFTKEGHDALKDISFEVKSGELACILGKSGCGKSTLLNIISGKLSTNSGEAAISYKTPSVDIGIYTVNSALLPWRNVVENITLGADLLDKSSGESAAKAKELISEFELSGSEKLYSGELSAGMAQRVLLARTLLTNPKLLLLDEPFSNLDVDLRQKIARYIRKYIKEGERSGVVISHSVEDALALADKIYILTPRPGSVFAKYRIVDDESQITSGEDLLRHRSFEKILSTLEDSFKRQDAQC